MLTDAHCRNAACPSDKKQARFSDSGGLYLQVSPAGSKRWFWKCRTAGLEKQLALGSYPDVSLTAARKARDTAKIQKADGQDPIQARKIAKLKESALGSDSFNLTVIKAAFRLRGRSRDTVPDGR
ncbi:MAG: Arm DNA-binding domain-containing protein [Polaromonas sp.]